MANGVLRGMVKNSQMSRFHKPARPVVVPGGGALLPFAYYFVGCPNNFVGCFNDLLSMPESLANRGLWAPTINSISIRAA